MFDLKKKQKTIKQQEDWFSAVSNLSPTEQFQRSKRNRTKRIIIRSIALFIAELGLIGMFNKSFSDERVTDRVSLEKEIIENDSIELDRGIYTGETDFGYFDGMGEFEFESGARYSGHWNNNEMEGEGTLLVPANGKYEGEFHNSKKHGQGIYTWKDGSVYDGEWENDKMSGKGTYSSSDGEQFIGFFRDNRFWSGTRNYNNATGSYTLQYTEGILRAAIIDFTDGSRYSGECALLGPVGAGELDYANGDSYVGSYDKGKRNGQGIYTWNSGDEYNGEWVNDQMSGTGIYTLPDGSFASGTFQENKLIDGSYTVINDFGKYEFTIKDQVPTAINMLLEDGTQYSGDIKDDKLTGKAKIKYSNGDTYSGKVKNGYKSGKGTYKWKSGAKYKGKWKKDKMNGKGEYYYPSKEKGYKLVGEFKNGLPNGDCTYYVKSDEYYETEWEEGKCVKVIE